jgi:hypothetical protein
MGVGGRHVIRGKNGGERPSEKIVSKYPQPRWGVGSMKNLHDSMISIGCAHDSESMQHNVNYVANNINELGENSASN